MFWKVNPHLKEDLGYLFLLWNMLLSYLWYHSENVDTVISVFENQTHRVNHVLSFCVSSHWQPTCRKSWRTSSPSYWTARQRSKASTTLPSCPPIPPWSCVNDSAASWLPSAGCPPRGDELGRGWDSQTPLPCTEGPAMDGNPWTSLNTCLPYKSRGLLLLAIIPLLLFLLL